MDFTLEQISELNRRHQSPLTDAQVKQLFDLLGGHPYLNSQELFIWLPASVILLPNCSRMPAKIMDRLAIICGIIFSAWAIRIN